ncbi:hypothetical protein ACWATR_09680 [Nostoc sp. UIC 10890]
MEKGQNCTVPKREPRYSRSIEYKASGWSCIGQNAVMGSVNPSVSSFSLAIPLTQLVYAVTTTAAIFTQSVEWRGITYQIKDTWNIRLTKYYPYQQSNKSLDTKISL